MNYLFVLLHNLVGKLFLLSVGVSVFLLSVKLFEEAHLSVKFLDDAFLVLDLVFEGVYLVAVEVLESVAQLLDLLAQNEVFFDFVIELLFDNLVASLSGPALFFLGSLLGLLEEDAELVVELSELQFQDLILLSLLLDELQPYLSTPYILATRSWYFFTMRRTPSCDSSSHSSTAISTFACSKEVWISLSSSLASSI
jgi:hypothetical protein